MAKFHRAIISSTFIDLKEYRRKAIYACCAAQVFPLCMETLASSPHTPTQESLQLVDDADIYIGIFAYRYGSSADSNLIESGENISITHAEYQRACERGIPRLIFCMSKDARINFEMLQKDSEAQQKLQELKELIKKEHTTSDFDNEDQLYSAVYQSLTNRKLNLIGGENYRPLVCIPYENPQSYPQSRYTRDRLIGRDKDIASLDRWIINSKSREYQSRVYIIKAQSGLGKSHLAWTWFNNITPIFFDGRAWLSLYQKGDVEHITKQALIQFIGLNEKNVEKMDAFKARERLFEYLKTQSLLLVLDGFEYALDLDKTTSTRTSRSNVLDSSTVDTPIESFILEFLRIENPLSRILITTTTLSSIVDDKNGNVYLNNFQPLAEEDAKDLWKNQGLDFPNPIDNFLYFVKQFNFHPLLIRILAGDIKGDALYNNDFNRWWQKHAQDPFGKLTDGNNRDLDEWISQLISEKLTDRQKSFLAVVSSFSFPCRYRVLLGLTPLMPELSIQEENTNQDVTNILNQLESRGLIDKISPESSSDDVSYRIHQLISTAAWEKTFPTSERRLELAVKIFNSLADLQFYDDAYEVFMTRLNRETFEPNLADTRETLLLKLFANQNIQLPPQLTEHDHQAITIAALTRSLILSGKLSQARSSSENHIAVREERQYRLHAAKAKYYLAYTLHHLGELERSEKVIINSLEIFRQENDIFWTLLSLKMLNFYRKIRGSQLTDEEQDEMTQCLQEVNNENANNARYADMIGTLINPQQERNMINEIAYELNYYEKRLIALIEEAKTLRSSGDFDSARQKLNEEIHSIGSEYILIRADAYLELARMESALDNIPEARTAAQQSIDLSSCQSGAYTYQSTLAEATRLSSRLAP